MNPYTPSCRTANIDSVEASTSNRSAVSTPTAASDVRFVIARMYAAAPTPQISHARHEGPAGAERVTMIRRRGVRGVLPEYPDTEPRNKFGL